MSSNLFPIFLLLFLSIGCSEKQDWIFEVDKDHKMTKFCFIGDTGFNSLTQRKVAKELLKENCHSIHFLGDIIYEDGISSAHDPEILTKFFQHYQEASEKGHHPRLHLVMGNHDYRGTPEAWTQVSEMNPSVFYPNSYYLVKAQKTCLLHFDTNLLRVVARWGQAIAQQLWLKSVKEKLQGCETKIALAHHPYKSSGKRHGDATGIMKLFLETNIVGDFDYYIAGHEHILSDEGIVNGTQLLISGAGGSTENQAPVGYLIIELDSQGESTHKFRIVD